MKGTKEKISHGKAIEQLREYCESSSVIVVVMKVVHSARADLYTYYFRRIANLLATSLIVHVHLSKPEGLRAAIEALPTQSNHSHLDRLRGVCPAPTNPRRESERVTQLLQMDNTAYNYTYK